MITKIVFIVTTLLFSVVSNAESLNIEGRGYCSPPENDANIGVYYVTFNATKPSDHSITGHAYITIFSLLDPNKNICELPKAFGQNPSKHTLWAVIGKSSESGFKQENLNNLQSDEKLQVRISYETYTKIQLKISEWYGEKYVLEFNDCVTFVNDIAKSTNIKVPERKITDLPYKYIHKLIELNKNWKI